MELNYLEESNKLVSEIKKMQISKNIDKLDYEMKKAKTVEITQECQTIIEKEWMRDRIKKTWIGTPTEQQELAKRLANNIELTKLRDDLKVMVQNQVKYDMDIFEKQEFLTNLRVFGGKK